MRLCSNGCIPCCDYCKHVEHSHIKFRGKIISAAPLRCKLHNDPEHEDVVTGCYYCEDFYCKNCDASPDVCEFTFDDCPSCGNMKDGECEYMYECTVKLSSDGECRVGTPSKWISPEGGSQ